MTYKLLLLAITQSLLLSLGQVFLKFGLQRISVFEFSLTVFKSLLLNWQLAVCGACYAVGSLLWMYIVKNFPLSVSYPLVSLSYVFGMIAAIVFFNETVDAIKWIGVFLIITGCVLIAK